MKVPIYNQSAEIVGEVDLNPQIFEVRPTEHLLAEAVRVQQSNMRKGLAHTKTRGKVSGGGIKPWKQKGTGRARAGSIRSPIWRSGGVALGPTSDRNWSLKLNKQARKKALFMSLSDKAANKRVVVMDAITLDPVKTKTFKGLLDVVLDKAKAAESKKMLFVLPKMDRDLARASRNLSVITPKLASTLNVLEVMKADTLVVMKDSLPVLEKVFLSK